MDSSRVLLALQEQEKWRDRRKRVEERIRQLQSRKRYFTKELETVRRRISQFGALLASLRGGSRDAETRPTGLRSLR